MKLLLDETLPHQLRHELPGHDCFTVAYMGRGGVENGELLRRAAAASFEAVVTKDANLQYEKRDDRCDLHRFDASVAMASKRLERRNLIGVFVRKE